MWVHNADRNPTRREPDCFLQIRVVADDEGPVAISRQRIMEQVRGEVHVRAFFFGNPYPGTGGGFRPSCRCIRQNPSDQECWAKMGPKETGDRVLVVGYRPPLLVPLEVTHGDLDPGVGSHGPD